MILAVLLSVVLGCYYDCKRKCGAHTMCTQYCDTKCNRSVGSRSVEDRLEHLVDALTSEMEDALPSARYAGYQKACQQDDDCMTGNCWNGKCAAPRRGRGTAGYEDNCNVDSDCASNNCYKYGNTQGFCDHPRRGRGTAGYEEDCKVDSNCASNNCYKYGNTQGFCDHPRRGRGTAGYEEDCKVDSDCASNNCYKYGNT